jgi:hypothetical protein
MREKIIKILEEAVKAPSGDNSQPWKFKISEDVLFVYNIPTRDNPYLNYLQSGSLIAHGALIENIKILSLKFGLNVSISIPSSPENDLVAQIAFSPADATIDPLVDYIDQRHTNRNVYLDEVLNDTNEKELISSAEEFNEIKVLFCKQKEQMKILGSAASASEIIILEDPLLSKYLFDHVVWTSKEENEKKMGLYIKTMEFNPIQKFIFKLASNEKFLRILKRMGLPKFVSNQDAKLYSTGGAIGIITIQQRNKENFINAGRVLQRLWLQATRLGLALQPITATLFFYQRIKDNQTEHLSEKHIELIKENYRNIEQIFKLSDSNIVMMFRIGKAPLASSKSSRMKPHVE